MDPLKKKGGQAGGAAGKVFAGVSGGCRIVFAAPPDISLSSTSTVVGANFSDALKVSHSLGYYRIVFELLF